MGTKRNELDETDDTLGGLAREGVALFRPGANSPGWPERG